MRNILTLALLVLTSAYVAADWDIGSIDPGRHSDSDIKWKDVKCDSNGNVRMIYCDKSANYGNVLTYNYWNGSTWVGEALNGDSETDWTYPSLAIDGNGKAWVAVEQELDGDGNVIKDLVCFERVGTNDWYKHTVDQPGQKGAFCDIVLDSNGYPCISYYDEYNCDLMFARYNGSTWTKTQLVWSGDIGEYTSIDFNHNKIGIAYYNNTYTALDFIYYNGSWQNPVEVDGTGDVGKYASLQFDSNGVPHIAYYKDDDDHDLRYAYLDGSTWNKSEVDTTDTVGEYCSLAVYDSEPWISYYDAENDDLKGATHDDHGWHVSTIDNTGDRGTWTAIDLTPVYHYPRIGYSVKDANGHWDCYLASWDNDPKMATKPTLTKPPVSFAVKTLGNPVSSNLVCGLTLSQSSNVALRLYDISGKLVQNKDVSAITGYSEACIDVSKVSNGFYVLVATANGMSNSAHVIVAH